MKVNYDVTTSAYSLFYSNAGLDPISNSYAYTFLNSYLATEKGTVTLFVGINSGNDSVADGAAYIDNYKSIPEPSTFALLTFFLFLFLFFRKKY